jgi:hypothetical protein
MEFLEFFPQFRAMVIVVVPRVLQGVIAALGDYYTWKFAERLYGRRSSSSWAAVRIPCPPIPETSRLISILAADDRLQSVAMVLFHAYFL